jgi:hypothetical protein
VKTTVMKNAQRAAALRGLVVGTALPLTHTGLADLRAPPDDE